MLFCAEALKHDENVWDKVNSAMEYALKVYRSQHMKRLAKQLAAACEPWIDRYLTTLRIHSSGPDAVMVSSGQST